jgi:hypothetical protein
VRVGRAQHLGRAVGGHVEQGGVLDRVRPLHDHVERLRERQVLLPHPVGQPRQAGDHPEPPTNPRQFLPRRLDDRRGQRGANPERPEQAVLGAVEHPRRHRRQPRDAEYAAPDGRLQVGDLARRHGPEDEQLEPDDAGRPGGHEPEPGERRDAEK